jgi:hypothetical protein
MPLAMLVGSALGLGVLLLSGKANADPVSVHHWGVESVAVASALTPSSLVPSPLAREIFALVNRHRY